MPISTVGNWAALSDMTFMDMLISIDPHLSIMLALRFKQGKEGNNLESSLMNIIGGGFSLLEHCYCITWQNQIPNFECGIMIIQWF